MSNTKLKEIINKHTRYCVSTEPNVGITESEACDAVKALMLDLVDKFNSEKDPIKIIEGLEKEINSL